MIDLVLATVARTDEPARFLDALRRQTHESFRVIVVDQNADDRLDPVLAELGRELSILHLRSGIGLSHGRNAGLAHADAEVVAFPDDDCWYGPDLLERVWRLLTAAPALGGVSGRVVDEAGRPTAGRWDTRAGPVTPRNLWTRTCSASLFLRRGLFEAVGPWDETLGAGAGTPWSSANDLDYVLRTLRRGFALRYDPTLLVHHPRKREDTARPDPVEGHRYGMGMGRAMRKNRVPAWLAAYHVGRAFGGVAVSAARGRGDAARFHLAVGRGRLRGWLLSPRKAPDGVRDELHAPLEARGPRGVGQEAPRPRQ
jgi:GT2 family glycosyltransferase